MQDRYELCACPVCNGRGELPTGFYSQTRMELTSNTRPEICRACNGAGYLFTTMVNMLCPACRGVGYLIHYCGADRFISAVVADTDTEDYNMRYIYEITCPQCGGKGYIPCYEIMTEGDDD